MKKTWAFFFVITLTIALMLTGCSLGTLVKKEISLSDDAMLQVETAEARMLKNIGAICVTNGEIKAGTYDDTSDSPAITKYLSGKWPTLKDQRTPMQLIITEAEDGTFLITTNATVDTPAPPT